MKNKPIIIGYVSKKQKFIKFIKKISLNRILLRILKYLLLISTFTTTILFFSTIFNYYGTIEISIESWRTIKNIFSPFIESSYVNLILLTAYITVYRMNQSDVLLKETITINNFNQSQKFKEDFYNYYCEDELFNAIVKYNATSMKQLLQDFFMNYFVNEQGLFSLQYFNEKFENNRNWVENISYYFREFKGEKLIELSAVKFDVTDFYIKKMVQKLVESNLEAVKYFGTDVFSKFEDGENELKSFIRIYYSFYFYTSLIKFTQNQHPISTVALDNIIDALGLKKHVEKHPIDLIRLNDKRISKQF